MTPGEWFYFFIGFAVCFAVILLVFSVKIDSHYDAVAFYDSDNGFVCYSPASVIAANRVVYHEECHSLVYEDKVHYCGAMEVSDAY